MTQVHGRSVSLDVLWVRLGSISIIVPTRSGSRFSINLEVYETDCSDIIGSYGY